MVPCCLNCWAGSADLAGSNLTIWSGSKGVTKDDASGNYLYYGVREFGMAAIMNGIALHGGFINYGATFLVFMEYMRNAVRMSALMKKQSIFVFTHDSIGLGEDGPTHQPVEQVASLRTTPNMNTWRPCDSVESAVAWKAAIERRDGPSSLVFSRQGLPHQDRDSKQLADVARGGYILKACGSLPDAIIIATGSEVSLAMAAAERLEESGKQVRVVSMPCTEIFDAQDAAYREAVFAIGCVRTGCRGGSARGLLVQVRRPGRAYYWYDQLWRIGSRRRIIQGVRLYGGQCCGRC